MTDLQINANELGKFILEAKRNTWASGKKVGMDSYSGKKTFSFHEGEYLYEDTYLGDAPFIGQELVYKKYKGFPKPIWGMNYYGRLTEEGKKYPDKEGLMNFLREALRANNDFTNPFRGPRSYHLLKQGGNQKDEKTYYNKSNRNIFSFEGAEIIAAGKPMDFDMTPLHIFYELNYHGGKI